MWYGESGILGVHPGEDVKIADLIKSPENLTYYLARDVKSGIHCYTRENMEILRKESQELDFQM